MSGTENSMQKLFARAASLLARRGSETPPAITMPDICCRRWTMPSASGNRIDPETANRARLLIAASRFARVFELAAPDAPGLFSFGAQFDPALADSLHDGSPIVGVSGVGLTLQDAFQGCIGEGIEYLSQLQTETDLLLKPGIDDWAGKLGPKALELVAALSERRMQPERALSWCRATQADRRRRGVASGRHLPAPTAGAARLRAAVPVEHRIGRRSVAGGRGTARSAGIDRARCGQPVVAGRSARPIDSAAA